jgi:sugar/nucleoside kinase (ribokinase family)
MTNDSRLDLLSIGEVLLDFIALAADDLLGAADFVRRPGGAPANVAVAVARLGGRAAFVGAVGDDPFGRVLLDALDGEGVDVSRLKVLPQCTTLAFVARNKGGIPDFLFYRGADAELLPDDVPPDLIASARFIYVSSMALLDKPGSDATAFAAEAAREVGTLLAVDPNLRPSSWETLDDARTALTPLLNAANVLKVNDEEARLLADTPNLDHAIKHLAAEHTLVVVTLGADGCLWAWAGKHGRVTSPRVDVLDSTGAGDAFMGALLAELARAKVTAANFLALQGEQLEAALRFACAAGALACTRPGAMAALPRREEVYALLESREP